MSLFASIPDKLGGGKPRIEKEQLENILKKSKNKTDEQIAKELNKKFTTQRGKEFSKDNIFIQRKRSGITTNVYKMPSEKTKQMEKIRIFVANEVKKANEGDKFVSAKDIAEKTYKKFNLKPQKGQVKLKGYPKETLPSQVEGRYRLAPETYPVIQTLETQDQKLDSVLKRMLLDDKPLKELWHRELSKRTGIGMETASLRLRNGNVPTYNVIKDEGGTFLVEILVKQKILVF